ncbi:hypothetical protein [Lentzea sp. HUAS12]|uniref:hypothetical protein n=1 Tax=Lentzea sp. HUAS12 TaxID=2951806 RepID=UPI0020A08F42|nr:hypothetical protein [Lentzea sp. HUAS12]USX52483.1 hypothetical protein ND450_45465 [Lentzea sp. HUAS12]
MWLGSLLTSSAESLGRLVLVSLIPNSVPAVFVVLTVSAGSFSGSSDWYGLRSDLRPDTLAVVLFVLAVALVTAVVQPFQIRVLRVLEGYWDGWAVTARIAPVFEEFQRRRRRELRRTAGRQPSDEPTSGSLHELVRHRRTAARFEAKKRRAERRLQRYPAKEPVEPRKGFTALNLRDIPVLPTGLGNALRAGETSGGERYGLNTLSSWPRLYPHFPESFAKGQASVRDALDAAANLCLNFFVTTIIGVVALHDEPRAYWIPAASAVLCGLSYMGAIAAATEYSTFIKTAYDLYRSELLKSARLPLPKDPAEELATFMTLSDFYSKAATDFGSAHGLALMSLQSIAYDSAKKDEIVIVDKRKRIRRNP